MYSKKLMVLVIGVLMAAAASAQVGKNLGLIDPNLAKRSELLALPGVTDKVADAILAARPILKMPDLDKALAGMLDVPGRKTLYGKLFRQMNLNTATREEILLVPDIAPRMTREFAEYRPFTSLEQFRREIGKYVSAAEVARLEQYVFVPLSLNKATPEAFKTIPGMSDRMVREFLEYRPYKSLEQFRREIGKYVDKKEVARLESYVTLD
jgi:DNA uptake protein ComE-like DNA-binding protein